MVLPRTSHSRRHALPFVETGWTSVRIITYGYARISCWFTCWAEEICIMCRAVVSLDILWRNVNGSTTVNSASVLHNRVKPDCWLLVEPFQPGNFSRFSTYSERGLSRFSLLHTESRRSLGPTRPPVQWLPEAVSPGPRLPLLSI
jgi:hypothetical protein